MAIIVSLVPAIALYLWLKNRKKDDVSFRELCGTALKRGILSVFPVLLCSAVFHIIIRLTGVKDANPLLYEALHAFLVLALAEELVKYLTFRRTLKNTDYKVSWVDVTALMTIVGIGFDLIESIFNRIRLDESARVARQLQLPSFAQLCDAPQATSGEDCDST